jgi:hypothetical protein
MVEGKIDTSIMVECFEQFSQQLAKRTYVFLDNAPVHRSQEFVRGYPINTGQLGYDRRYSKTPGMPVTGGHDFRGLKPL